ncbi:MAG: hypothetical protein AB8C02_15010 [Halioglobus sp.]
MSESASGLLIQFSPQLHAAAEKGPVIDLACGNGRNGLALLAMGIDVVFADRKVECLEAIQQTLEETRRPGPRSTPLAQRNGEPAYWSVDFEVPGSAPLEGHLWGGAIVFRYLHRPLFTPLKNAIAPGGLVVYQTFTVDQAQYGRPKNPDFLLQHGELEDVFSEWDVLFSEEGVEPTADGSGKRALASIVARKPAASV